MLIRAFTTSVCNRFNVSVVGSDETHARTLATMAARAIARECGVSWRHITLEPIAPTEPTTTLDAWCDPDPDPR